MKKIIILTFALYIINSFSMTDPRKPLTSTQPTLVSILKKKQLNFAFDFSDTEALLFENQNIIPGTDEYNKLCRIIEEKYLDMIQQQVTLPHITVQVLNMQKLTMEQCQKSKSIQSMLQKPGIGPIYQIHFCIEDSEKIYSIKKLLASYDIQ